MLKHTCTHFQHRYQAWAAKLNALDSTKLQSRLDAPLMRRAASAGQEDGQVQGKNNKDTSLECNFDEHLLALFNEVHYWDKGFQGEFAIPYVALDLCNQREKLRVMREHVMLVVRAYNNILVDLAPEVCVYVCECFTVSM